MDGNNHSLHLVWGGLHVTASAPLRDAFAGMNKTEREYALQIINAVRTGSVLWWAFEPASFTIGEGARYTPDFAVQNKTGEVYFVETKGGFIREASLVRMRAFVKQYPFRLLLAQKTKEKGWTTTLVGNAVVSNARAFSL